MAKLPPRKVPSRDDKYMAVSHCVAQFFSKDPHTQVAAFIVSANNEPLGWGFNGPPSVFNDDDLDWSRESKYDFMIHAEINAIRFARRRGSLVGATMYVTARPCKICILEIVAEKIKKVVFFPIHADPNSSLCDPKNIAKVEELAKKGNVELEEYKGNLNFIRDAINDMKRKGIFE